MEDVILRLIKEINRRDILPENCFRRNSIYYPLVSYINHVIALYTSESYEDLVIFIKRTDKEIEKLELLLNDIYKLKCLELLIQISNKIPMNVDPSILELLPNQYQRDAYRHLKCPQNFCFHWVQIGDRRLPFVLSGEDEAIKRIQSVKPVKHEYCGCQFGKCKRIENSELNKDWYEPNEPELFKHGLPINYFRNDLICNSKKAPTSYNNVFTHRRTSRLGRQEISRGS